MERDLFLEIIYLKNLKQKLKLENVICYYYLKLKCSTSNTIQPIAVVAAAAAATTTAAAAAPTAAAVTAATAVAAAQAAPTTTVELTVLLH